MINKYGYFSNECSTGVISRGLKTLYVHFLVFSITLFSTLVFSGFNPYFKLFLFMFYLV